MTETQVCEQIASHLRHRYPDVRFRFDGLGINNPSPATRALYGRLNSTTRGYPDLLIIKSHHLEDIRSCGLALEIKKPGTRLRKRNGEWASQHIEEQADMLDHFRNEGYYAEFAVGAEEAIQYIDDYLGEPEEDDGAF